VRHAEPQPPMSPALRRGRLALPVLALAALALAIFAPAASAKTVINGFGTTGTHGGEFAGNPSGVAVNTSGNGAPAGTIYVLDSSQNRIQRLSPSGAFQRAWGQNVSGRDERQLIKFDLLGDDTDEVSSSDLGGTFTLSFDPDGAGPQPPETTDPIDPADARDIDDYLTALPSIDPGDVVGAGINTANLSNPYTVRFTGGLSGTDVPQITVDASGLFALDRLGPGVTPSIEATTAEDGAGGPSAGFEICTSAPDCQDSIFPTTAGTAAIPGSTFNGGQLRAPTGIALDQSTGNVYVTESGNRRVSQFDADGNFLRAFGWDVVMPGGTGNVSTNAFEICTVAADCQRGDFGANGGQFGIDNGRPAIGPGGEVWVGDDENRRIQRFEADGDFVAAYGWDVDALGGAGGLESCTSTAPGACQASPAGSTPGQFLFRGPQEIAFDSTGNLYALESHSFSNKRVQKFNPTLTSASVFATATLANQTTQPVTHIAASEGATRLQLSLQYDGGDSELPASERQWRIVELDPSDASITDSGVATNVGTIADGGSGKLYATSDRSPGKLLELDGTPLTDPLATLDPVTSHDDTTATFSGTVDPMGGWVECQFQYTDEPPTAETEWTDAPEPECGGLANGGGAQAVQEGATGLIPNTHYYVRLRAIHPFTAAETFSTVREFDTNAVPPVLSNVGATGVTDAVARLVATIDPRHSATSYVFEYGASPGTLDQSTDPVEIGDGTTPLVVSQEIEGLANDTDYYFKVTATNGAGPAESGVDSFHTRAEPLPSPAGRAYEQVSPVDKNLGSATRFFGDPSFAARDGNAVGYFSDAGFADPPGQNTGFTVGYVAHRGSEGWQTKPVPPVFCSQDLTTFPVTRATPDASLSADLDRGVIARPESASCPHPPLDPAAPLPAKNLYRADFAAAEPDYRLLTPESGAGTPAIDSSSGAYAAASDDRETIVYSSTGRQIGGAADAPVGNFTALYAWKEGNLSLISRGTSGVPFATSSAIGGGADADSLNAISADGRLAFFQNPTSGDSQELYLRDTDAGTTYRVSASECTASCGPSEADVFAGASSDGERALFISGSKLTDSDTSTRGDDLFLYTHSADPPSDSNLTDLSIDEEPADGTEAFVQGVIGASDDLDTVFFAAEGQIVAGGPTAAGPKLYRWAQGEGVEYLGTLSSGDSSNWSAGQRRVTPDGAYLMVTTSVRLDPVADSDTDVDVYRWDAASGWLCPSCQLPGEASVGGASTGRVEFTGGLTGELPRAIADDGRVFFQTPDALVPADTNGDGGCPVSAFVQIGRVCRDVYEWHAGTHSLISSGGSQAANSWDAVGTLLGAGADGRDVFFFTREQLVASDTDDSLDIYDARIGGGFPEPPAAGAPCDLNAGACEGAGSSAPEQVGAATPNIRGGNPEFPPNCSGYAATLKRQGAAARRAARRAQKLHRAARRSRAPRRSRAMRRRASRYALAAKRIRTRARRTRAKAKRCRTANARAANAERRTAR